MKKIKAILFLFCIASVFCAFKYVPPCTGCKHIEVNFDKGIYVFRIPIIGDYKLTPFVSENLVYNKDVFKKTSAELVVNAGYFDAKNQQTTSYVVIDNNLALDPELNKNLVENEKLKPHMKKILNRTEFRILDCNGETRYDITAHNSRVPYRCKLRHSIQAGPLIYPDLRLKEEYFVEKKDGVVVRDVIFAYTKRPRTAIGIKDNDVYIIVATNARPLTLKELASVCSDLQLDKAMNFDGGGSTSLDYQGSNDTQFKNLHIASEKNNAPRKLKSFLVIE